MRNIYTTILTTLATLLAAIAVRAQTGDFRIVGGIPHMPVVANTTAVTSPVTGAMVFSQADGKAMVYNGAAWYGLTDLPDPVGSDSEPYFRVVNGLPCMAVVSSGSMFEPGVGLVYYADYGDQGLIVGNGAGYSPITDFVGSGLLNEKAMVASGMNDMLAMPVLNAAPTGITAGAFYMNATTNQFEVYDGSAWVELVSNTPPQVRNVTISGTLGVGQTVSASYTYTDAENDPEGATTFQWYRATSSAGAGSTVISGATAQTYTLTSADEGNYIGVKVTAVASNGITPGDAVTAYSSTPVVVCPSPTLTITHTAGSVAPVTQTITYKLAEINMEFSAKQCWLAQNLGATYQPTSPTDSRDNRAGWYWQFNRKQGYAVNGSGSIPSAGWVSSISENSDWTSANDPCTLLLGSDWRLPTRNEWNQARYINNWHNYTDAYNSSLKIHTSGGMYSGTLAERGANAIYWSRTQGTNGYGVIRGFFMNNEYENSLPKNYGYPLRCVIGN